MEIDFMKGSTNLNIDYNYMQDFHYECNEFNIIDTTCDMTIASERARERERERERGGRERASERARETKESSIPKLVSLLVL